MKEQNKEGVLMLSAHPGGVEVKIQRLSEISGTAIFHCAGYIDTYNAPAFEAVARQVIQQGVKNLIFDLGRINYISSSGIGSFTNLLKEVKPKAGDIVLVSLTKKVEEVLQLLGFLTFFNITHSLEEALEYFPQSKGTEVPFSQMQAVTDSFGLLEGFVEREKQPGFYGAVLKVLKQIQDLQKVNTAAQV